MASSTANPNPDPDPDPEPHQTYTPHLIKPPLDLSTEELEKLKQHILDWHAHGLHANQCSSVHAQRIHAPPRVVWHIVRRFDIPHIYNSFIESCSLPDNFTLTVGSTRHVTATYGPSAATSTERLDILDDDRRITGFSIVGGDSRLKNYRSVTSVHGFNREGRIWTVVLESYVYDVPEGSTDEDRSLDVDTVIKLNLQKLASVVIKLARQPETFKTTEKDEDDFTAVFEEDSEHNVELWRGLVGCPEASLPKKGDLVVYFPQGHLEYVALFPSWKPFFAAEAPSFGLPPQLVCRVVHVQLIVNKKNDEVCADVTLLPESESVGLSSEGKEAEELGMDGTKVGGSHSKPAFGLFSKTLEISDTKTLLVPMQYANIIFQDYVLLDSSQEVVASDFQGTEWMLELNSEDTNKNYSITKGWSEFVRDKHLVSGDTVVFLRGKDKKLRLGIRRADCCEFGVPESIIAKNYGSYNFLSPVADAVSHMSMFHVFYCRRANLADFVIPYEKYMKSIRTTWPLGANFRMQYKMDDSLQRCSGVVKGMADLDPYKWPKSKWRCLMVSWDKDTAKNYKKRISPWEIISDVCTLSSMVNYTPHLKSVSDVRSLSPRNRIKFPPQFKKPGIKVKGKQAKTILKQCDVTGFRESVQLMTGQGLTKNSLPVITCQQEKREPFVVSEHQKAAQLMTGQGLSKNSLPFITYQQEKREPFVLSEYQSTSRCAIMEILERSKYPKPFKISKCVDQLIPLDPMVHSSLEYWEFDSCLLNSPTLKVYFPHTLKKLKITDCVNPEHLLILLMDQKGVFLESLDIDGCSNLLSLPIDKLPSTLRELKIVNCMKLKSLSESVDIENHGSVGLGQLGDASGLELRQLVICSCPELEFFPEGLHNFNHLELLLVSNCSSLMSFPEGGLPNNSLVALLIYECESLRFLPKHLNKVTSLRFLNISDCPSLKYFPEGGLPPNLVSLCIIDCENLVHLSHRGLHKLKDLKSYTIVGGRLALGEN